MMNPIDMIKKAKPTLAFSKKNVELSPKQSLILSKKSAPTEALKKAIKK